MTKWLPQTHEQWVTSMLGGFFTVMTWHATHSLWRTAVMFTVLFTLIGLLRLYWARDAR